MTNLLENTTILDLFAAFFLLGGLLFFVVGTIGLIRLPDVYHRMHAVTKCATLGIVGFALAAACHTPTASVLVKTSLLILFAFVAGPVGSHMLAKAALRDGAKHWPGMLSDDFAEDQQTPQ